MERNLFGDLPTFDDVTNSDDNTGDSGPAVAVSVTSTTSAIYVRARGMYE